MEFVKNNYEKVILIAVLAGVIGFLVFLPFVISSDQQKQKDMVVAVTTPKVVPLPELDLIRHKIAAERVLTRANFDFSTTNKLFNSVEWKKAPNGELIKIKNGNEAVEALVVVKITPLYFAISLDQVTTNQTGARYAIGVERQAAINPALRKKQQRYVSEDDKKKDAFTLIEIKGAPENPSELVLKLADTGETVSVSKEKPFRRVDGYATDLRYDLEKKSFNARRVNTPVSFGGEDYIVVAIDADEVILSAQSNQKRTTLKYAP